MKRYAWMALLLVGCASMQRDCASCNAETLGADWIVVQLDMNGRPFRCWELTNVSIVNEGQSDGVYWRSPAGHLVHISGLYNRVQVTGGRWAEAAAEVGVTLDACRQIRTTVQGRAP